MLSKITLDYINELIKLNYTFNTPFKVSLKTIVMEVLSQSDDGIYLKIITTLLEMFLRYLSHYHCKVFHEDGYDKINQLSIFKCNLASRFIKLRDTATKLD